MKKTITQLVAVVVILCSMAGCNAAAGTTPPGTAAPQKTQIQLPLSLDWAMTAYQITPEGEVAESFPITIKGDIWEDDSGRCLGLEMNWGDSFRYQYEVSDSPGYDVSLNHPTDRAMDFCAAAYTYDRDDNCPAFCYYSVAPDMEYFIGYWGEEFGYYLVAATDPNVEPADILAYFADCLPYYIIKYG